MKLRTNAFILVGMVLLVCFGLLYYVFFGRPTVRDLLPKNATDVREPYDDGGFHGDFTHCVRARIDEKDFDAFADRLGLDRTYTTKGKIVYFMGCNEHWWTPPDSWEGARFERDEDIDYHAMAIYHEGYVYYLAYGW